MAFFFFLHHKRLSLQYVNIFQPCCCLRFQISALPNRCHPVVQLERNLLENRDCTPADLKCMCHQMAEDFRLRNAIFPPLLSEFLMHGFYEAGRGAFSCCLRRTPISVLIHYLWRIGTHRPRNTHSATFLLCTPTTQIF